MYVPLRHSSIGIPCDGCTVFGDIADGQVLREVGIGNGFYIYRHIVNTDDVVGIVDGALCIERQSDGLAVVGREVECHLLAIVGDVVKDTCRAAVVPQCQLCPGIAAVVGGEHGKLVVSACLVIVYQLQVKG